MVLMKTVLVGERTMEVVELMEHEDGSATYRFDMTPEEHDAMCRSGIVWAIVSGITGVSVNDVLADHLAKLKEENEEVAEHEAENQSDT
jgi:hypothetical protein